SSRLTQVPVRGTIYYTPYMEPLTTFTTRDLSNDRHELRKQAGLHTHYPTSTASTPAQNAASYRRSKKDHRKTWLHAGRERRRVRCVFSRRYNTYRNSPTNDDRAVSHHVP